jgi:hypothetical protein
MTTPPPYRRMGRLAWTGIGGGLVIILGAIWAVTGGGRTAGSPPSGSSPHGQLQLAGQAAAGRQVTRDGNLAFQFKGITCGYAATLAVYADPAVTGAQPVGTTEYDARGRELPADVNGAGLAGDQDDTRLSPGTSITALLPFNIPAGDSITRLELHDPEFSGVAVRL